MSEMNEPDKDFFEKTAPVLDDPDEGGGSLVQEFVYFLKENKKWWLVPLVLIFLVLCALIVLQSTPAAPFIYSLF